MYPRRMKHIELTIHKNDADAVIEYLGRRAVMQFSDTKADNDTPEPLRKTNASAAQRVLAVTRHLERLRSCAEFLDISVPSQPDENGVMASPADEAASEKICAPLEELQKRENALIQEKIKLEDTIDEAKAFSNMNVAFSDLARVSYFSLRVGRLDPKAQTELREILGERAVIVPLGTGDRIVAASSRKGRFALDTELKNHAFEPFVIPEGYKGIPEELIEGLELRHTDTEKALAQIADEKEKIRAQLSGEIKRLVSCCRISLAIEQVKNHFSVAENFLALSGWLPSDRVAATVKDISRISEGRVAIRACNPGEVSQVRSGGEKVPVSLKHGPFVRGFEGMVFSYGAPVYGTIDPTALVAFFYTLLFGIMFGDMGHGFVLFFLGLLASRRGPLKKFIRFSTPLIAVGTSSMIMGFLTGEIFCSEHLLVAPTRALSAALTGHQVDHILTLMPLAEKGGSVQKLFYFFGFTIALGIIINTLGLVINIVNRCTMKQFQQAIFSRNGLAGLVFFWYALFMAMRILLGGQFQHYDIVGLVVPCVFIFLGHPLWRFITRKKPLLEHKLSDFIIEGVMEVWETATTYFSNTASFLRVGAFALSHAVLAYIVFYFCEAFVHSGGFSGSFWAVFLFLFGNSLIIVLEGLVVSIQVLRLQYYEFFNKFFTDRGTPFAPFCFRNMGVLK